MGVVDISFQSAGTGKYATPTMHINFHFAPLAVSYNFPTVKSMAIEFLLNRTQQYAPVLFWQIPQLLPGKELLCGHSVAYSKV